MGAILLIVNPVAGKLRARTTLMDILEEYSAANQDVNVRISQYRAIPVSSPCSQKRRCTTA